MNQKNKEHKGTALGALSGSSVVESVEQGFSEQLRNILDEASEKFNLTEKEKILIQKTIRLSEKINGNRIQAILLAFQHILNKILESKTSTFQQETILELESDEDIIKGLWLEDLENNKNPIVIYDGDRPLYWNQSMQKITGYDFDFIKSFYKGGGNIMHLLYAWSTTELRRVESRLGAGQTYENAVFTLEAKNGEKHMIAWFTRFVEYNGKIYTIRSGSEETSKIIQFLDQSNTAVQDFFNDIMNDKDPYTKGHINRVRSICDMIGKNLGMTEYALKQLGNMAFFHDLGKRYIPDEILKKTGAYTTEEKMIMDSHTGIGIKEVLNSGYEAYAEGMIHHCDFYNEHGDPSLKFQNMLAELREGKEIDNLMFNRLMGYNIPEVGRMISIADTIDAIGSRRIYSEKAGYPINKIIGFITEELLESCGLKTKEGKISLNENVWLETSDPEKIKLPYCIEFRGKRYIPAKDSRIQFDPLILIRNYENGDLSDQIKLVILENDKEIVKEKVIEFFENITRLEEKKAAYKRMVKAGHMDIQFEFIFTEYDENELRRLKSIYDNLITIDKEYEEG